MNGFESTNKKTVKEMTEDERIKEIFRLGVDCIANSVVMSILLDSLNGDHNVIALKIEASGMEVLNALDKLKEKYAK